MIYTKKIQDAVNFAIQIHELEGKQKRKSNDLPYITHPLTVGLILTRAGADEDLIVAGILHDTIEDSIEEKKVTGEMINEKFGRNVMDLVLSVTEEDKDLPWDVRKKESLKHIENFSNDSVILKSADLISNVSEIYFNYQKIGDPVFSYFKGKKEKTILNHRNLIAALLLKWPSSPLADDLKALLEILDIMSV